MLREEALRTWKVFLCSGKLPPSLCFDNYAFLPNSCFRNMGKIIKYLLCHKVDLFCSTFSINQMFLPRNFPFKTQLDCSYSIFELINAESSLPFWLLPSSFISLPRSKTIKIRRRRRKGSSVVPRGAGENHPKCRCVTKWVPNPVSVCSRVLYQESTCVRFFREEWDDHMKICS